MKAIPYSALLASLLCGFAIADSPESVAQYSQTQMGPHYDTYRNDQGQNGCKTRSIKGNGIDWNRGTYNRNAIFQSTYKNDFDFGEADALIFMEECIIYENN